MLSFAAGFITAIVVELVVIGVAIVVLSVAKANAQWFKKTAIKW